MTGTQQPLELMGAPGSPYTRKMLSLLRYRRISYAVRWGSGQEAADGYPTPKVRLLPTFYFPDANGDLEAVVDSTPIIRRLETEYEGRSVIPTDPVLTFYNYLIEDFADEWLTKAMFHYRWAHEIDAANAGPMIVFWSKPTLSDANAKTMSDHFSKRQIGRLYVVGSNEITARTIEASYTRFIDILDQLIQYKGFVLGARPSSADFAIFGQLTQLAIVEPTSAAVTRDRSLRVRAWLDRVEDLSGLTPETGEWFSPKEAADALYPLLKEIGRVYTPFLLANAQAVMAGDKNFDTKIDERVWAQPSFPYQAKCLQWLREEHSKLGDINQQAIDAALAGTGCETLFE